MGRTCRILTILSILYVAVVLQQFHKRTKPLAKPSLDAHAYWGRSENKDLSKSEELLPQNINYHVDVTNELWRRLNQTVRYHDPLEGTKHEYGINTYTFEEFIEYWRTEYMPKWPERLARLNTVPHFSTYIQGLRIHYVHIQPENLDGKPVVPLLLLHGWPGSIVEFYELFTLLSTPNPNSKYVYEVIAPSLPGFAWSEGSARTGFGPAEISVVLRNLMLRIGHERFVIQGGDWGSIIGSHLATLYPENVIGYHSNFCMPKTLLSVTKLVVASFWPTLFMDEQHVEQVYPLSAKIKLILMETGSFHIQATKPETLGIVLTSPTALAAYLQEKFISALPDHDIDDVLDNTMIYYLTNSFTTGARLYAEDVSEAQAALELWRVPTDVPTACARFRNDIGQSLDWQLRDKYPNLVQSTWHSNGGHFAALEVPEVLFEDLVAFVEKLDIIAK